MSISYRFMITALCCCVLFGAKGFVTASDSLRREERDGRYFVIHEVEAKETLYSLSKRYFTEIDSIKNNNELRNGGIDLGQILMIPIDVPETIVDQVAVVPDVPIDTLRKIHVVEAGQTVYFISRKYDLQDEQIRRWNDLDDNNLSIGMTLYVSPPIENEQSAEEEVVAIDDELNGDEAEVDKGIQTDLVKEEEVQEESKDYYTHYVQSGETLSQLARRFETVPDSLIFWNDLENATLRIGDKLLVKKTIERDSLNHSNPSARFTSYGSKYWKEMTEQDTLIHEEGIAGTIENIIETRKFLALHRTLPVGSLMKVINLMNHESLEVRVVGKLPNTGLNRNMMIRFTDVTFKQLGIIDKKSRVEIIYPEKKG